MADVAKNLYNNAHAIFGSIFKNYKYGKNSMDLHEIKTGICRLKAMWNRGAYRENMRRSLHRRIAGHDFGQYEHI
jgi:hypothetical protein